MSHHFHPHKIEFTVWRFISPYGESEYAARPTTPNDANIADATKQIVWRGLAYSGDEAESEARHRTYCDNDRRHTHHHSHGGPR